jgi:hypothetical protein
MLSHTLKTERYPAGKVAGISEIGCREISWRGVEKTRVRL